MQCIATAPGHICAPESIFGRKKKYETSLTFSAPLLSSKNLFKLFEQKIWQFDLNQIPNEIYAYNILLFNDYTAYFYPVTRDRNGVFGILRKMQVFNDFQMFNPFDLYACSNNSNVLNISNASFE